MCWEKLLFSNGYLATQDVELLEPVWPTSWDSSTIGAMAIFHSPTLQVSSVSVDDFNLGCIGNMLDCKLNSSNPEIILQHLGEQLATSEADFHDHVDWLAGRFVLFVGGREGMTVYPDAAANRSIYYSVNEPHLSSHSNLLARAANETQHRDALSFRESKLYQTDRDSYFPGVATPFDAVRSLTPNTALELPEMSVTRVFPRTDRTEKHVGAVAEDVAGLMASQVEMLADETPLAVSLTAGLDSRLTLAATRNVSDDVFYYTMVFNEQSRDEATVAAELCSRLGLDHHVIEVPQTVDQEFQEVFTENTAGMSAPFRARMARALYEQYPEGHLHLKSNVAEIGRTFYRDRFTTPPPVSPSIMALLYGTGSSTSFVKDAFREFSQVTGFEADGIHGYDPYDLFYWEHRIGIWQGLSLLEWDVAQETHILYNCRRLLDRMLSVPFELRRDNTVFYEAIEELWPGVMAVPIDAHEPETRSSSAEPLKRVAKSLILRLKRARI